MTYDDIAAWVEENFDVSTYGTAKELWLEVGKRFNEDNMYLPPEAEDNISNLWEESVGVKQPIIAAPISRTLEEYISPIPPEARVEVAPQELFQPYNFELGSSDLMQMPPILQEALPEKQPFTLQSLGRAIGSRFKRLFRL